MNKITIVFAKQLVKEYGENITLGELLDKLQKGRKYKCPNCDGNGIVSACVDPGHPNMDELHRPAKFEMQDCDLCEGHGYTKKRKRPIVKTQIIGYE